jgi:hypothetical protein
MPANLEDVPDFEKPIASKMKLVPGDEPGTVAHTVSRPFLPDNNKIYIDDPKALDQADLNHEVLHKIQARTGAVKTDPGVHKDYDYGGIAGLMQLRQQRKGIDALTDEKQAKVLEDYTRQRGVFEQKQKSGTLSPAELNQAAFMDKVYAPFLKQEQHMADQGINVTPDAPGPPPAELTGAEKALPGMGGPTLYATHQQTGHRVMTRDGGKTWQPAQ